VVLCKFRGSPKTTFFDEMTLQPRKLFIERYSRFWTDFPGRPLIKDAFSPSFKPVSNEGAFCVVFSTCRSPAVMEREEREVNRERERERERERVLCNAS